jgi:hypothetical protein
MRLAALALLLTAAGGCWYDRPNPWDTSSDREEYLDMKEAGWRMELETLREDPRVVPAGYEDVQLEGWRDTVLVNADAAVLARMREQSMSKLSALDGMLRSHGEINENNKTQITEAYRLWRLERRRLQLIDHRLRPSS